MLSRSLVAQSNATHTPQRARARGVKEQAVHFGVLLDYLFAAFAVAVHKDAQLAGCRAVAILKVLERPQHEAESRRPRHLGPALEAARMRLPSPCRGR